MWPVIVREVRAASRGRGNYWLRLLAAIAACGAALVSGLFSMKTAAQGKDVFAALHMTTLSAIWLFVPMVAADCLSRERREGTLGLLFLTPLSPLNIVAAKTVAQAVRAFTMWLATLPILVLPMVMGGVTGTEALLSVLINATSFCLALGIGIWISARSTRFNRSIIAAGCIATICFLIYLMINVVLAIYVFSPPVPFVELDSLEALMVGFVIVGNVDDAWKEIANNFGGRLANWIWALVGGLAFSIVVLALLAWRGARVLQSTWQVVATGGFWTRVGEKLCTPVIFRNVYRRWLRWSLNSNPVGWLERRAWSSRTVRWAWLAILAAVYGFILTEDSLLRHEFTETQVLFSLGLAATAAFGAAASFRRERDNGVLTLLLVSPLSVKQIVVGRLRALWNQYVPALALLFGTWAYFHGTFGRRQDPFWMAFFAMCFLAIPVIGLYCSLWRQTFFGALFWTGMLGFVVPLVASLAIVQLASELQWLEFPASVRNTWLIVVGLAQCGIAATTLALLFRKLRQRSFRTLPAM